MVDVLSHDPETNEIMQEMAAAGEIELEPAKPEEKPLEEPPKEPSQPVVEPPKEPEAPQEPAQPEPQREPLARVPVRKYMDEKRKREEAEQEAAELRKKLDEFSQRPAAEQTDEEVKALATELGLEESTVTKILDAAAKRAPKAPPSDLSPEDIKLIKEQRRQVEEQQAFENEYKETLPVLKELFPDLSDTEIEALKPKVREVAYTKGNEEKSLAQLVVLHRASLVPPKKKAAEPSRGGAGGGTQEIDVSDPDSIDWGSLSDEDFDKASEALAKKSSGKKFKVAYVPK